MNWLIDKWCYILLNINLIEQKKVFYAIMASSSVNVHHSYKNLERLRIASKFDDKTLFNNPNKSYLFEKKSIFVNI